MQKKYYALAAAMLLSAVLIAASNGIPALDLGHSKHDNRTQFIKKHRRNRTTVQIDSFSVGVIGGNPADSLWGVRGLGKDTSVAFQAWPYMSHRICFDDSTSDDSVALKIKLFMGSRPERFSRNRSWPPPFGQTYNANYWALVDSVSYTGHLPVWKNWTASAIPSAPWCYLVIEGQAANSKVSRVIGTIVADHWSELPK